jgi:hypothetical protein
MERSINLQCSRLVQEDWMVLLRRELNKHLDKVMDYKRHHPYAVASCIDVVCSILGNSLQEPWNMKFRKVGSHRLESPLLSSALHSTQ